MKQRANFCKRFLQETDGAKNLNFEIFIETQNLLHIFIRFEKKRKKERF